MHQHIFVRREEGQLHVTRCATEYFSGGRGARGVGNLSFLSPLRIFIDNRYHKNVFLQSVLYNLEIFDTDENLFVTLW